MNQLKTKIQSLKEIIKDLKSLKSNPEAKTISQLLKIITDLCQEVDHRLTELEKK